MVDGMRRIVRGTAGWTVGFLKVYTAQIVVLTGRG